MPKSTGGPSGGPGPRHLDARASAAEAVCLQTPIVVAGAAATSEFVTTEIVKKATILVLGRGLDVVVWRRFSRGRRRLGRA